MTIIEIIDAFHFYGLDIIALAALTTLTVQLLKVTLMKNCNKKIATFLPFAFGCIFYAVYAGVLHLSVRWVIENYVDVIEHGFSVGALSTVVYVWYEQFIREKETTDTFQSVVATLIEGYVPDDNLEEIAKSIAEAIEKDVTGDGAKRTADILNEYRAENVTENDVKLLAKLIIETLAHINTSA